ncbi:MAG: hypothetical protein QM831_36030 [Kofleriaceae bacterium]
MRGAGLVLLVIVELVLGVLLLSSAVDEGIPFTTSYEPRHYAELLMLAILVNACAYWLVFAVSIRFAKIACFVTFAISIALYIAFAIYHGQHPDPWVSDGWEGSMRGTAFHVQLAWPTFVTLGFIAACFGLRSAMPATEPLPPARVI